MVKFRIVRMSLAQVMADHGLASLGDAFVNFGCSLALSHREAEPLGVKVKGNVLAEALRKAGLRKCLGSRMSRHELADAAEALLVYGWLNGCVALDECVRVFGGGATNPVDDFAVLLATVRNRVTLP
jgi:hypothetical protein